MEAKVMAPALAQMGIIFLTFGGISKAFNNVQVLKPRDLSIKVPRLGEVLLSWKPSVNPEPESYLIKYNVLIKTPMKEEQYTTRNNTTNRTMALHKGLCAQVCVIYYWGEKEAERSRWARAELHASPERINPPVNITVLRKQESLCAEWLKPVAVWPSPCFTYEINVSDWVTGSRKLLTVETNSICMRIDSQNRFSVQVRAGGNHRCGNSKQWSAWSKPVFSGRPQMASMLLLSLVYGTLFGILVLGGVLCRRFQLHRRLFPQVPAPRNPFKDLLSDIEEPIEGALEVISDIEDLESDA
uniref:Interleukin-5 receptor subunit alpha isoform X3 n=1 Tax=Geotrypetes seraphini TaxID=260995 RepID=A0A6P8NYW8_GEOSA|nr:interleukin-5 receptor subunit alpha isoform X3 [Geotrypetes seraphini]